MPDDLAKRRVTGPYQSLSGGAGEAVVLPSVLEVQAVPACLRSVNRETDCAGDGVVPACHVQVRSPGGMIGAKPCIMPGMCRVAASQAPKWKPSVQCSAVQFSSR
eukprot:346716-Rhodomonas_salina.2